MTTIPLKLSSVNKISSNAAFKNKFQTTKSQSLPYFRPFNPSLKATIRNDILQDQNENLPSSPSSSNAQTPWENERNEKASAAEWSTEDSAELYRIHGWGSPYFGINRAGNVTVRPHGSEAGEEIDLFQLVNELQADLSFPMVIRFPDIISHRMRVLQMCFNSAVKHYGYKGSFRGVFPVKSNQDRWIVEEVVRSGKGIHFGLEVGSKPELLVALAKLPGRCSPDSLLVCNGYKDKDYMEAALMAQKLGIQVVIVLEQVEELPLLLSVSASMRCRPVIGVRARLSTKHAGHWGGTSGEGAKFGLTVSEILAAMETLEQSKMLDCLQLLHFHIGSQIPSISILKEAMREASHLYCEMALLGANMTFVDVGGGLGIDYDGSKSQSQASTNYSIQNYANDVVAALLDACVLKGVPQPIIVSESGRALASHHSVLVCDILGCRDQTKEKSERQLAKLVSQGAPGGTQGQLASKDQSGDRQAAAEYFLGTFLEVYSSVGPGNFQEAYNDAKQFKSEALALFKLGCLSLQQRALAEALHQSICHKVLEFARQFPDVPDELLHLQESMAATYHMNFSVFRSAPDSWAIQQLFPIVPIHRLGENPTVPAILADLTCDSDGKICRFIGHSRSRGEVSGTLPLHELRDGEQYLLGLFLGGVYQEVMGSSHNLFGKTAIVHVRSPLTAHLEKENGHGNGVHPRKWSVERFCHGQTAADVMSTVGYEAGEMSEEVQRALAAAVASGNMSVNEAEFLQRSFENKLNLSTYLEKKP